jgi:hypothetical protein
MKDRLSRPELWDTRKPVPAWSVPIVDAEVGFMGKNFIAVVESPSGLFSGPKVPRRVI